MNVALVHEFLTQFGGAERVLQALHEMFPKAPIFVLVKDEKIIREHFPKADIRASWLQKLPGWYKQYLVLMPKAIESLELSGYDLVISDSSAFAKGVITKPPTKHISYIHTPTRYLWGETEFYLKTAAPWLLRPLLSLIIPWLRRWDFKAAQRPDILIANSKEVQSRIKKYYHRDITVIHPFVDDRFLNSKFAIRHPDFYLTGGRLVPYKHYDIVVDAFKKNGKPLKIVGSGYGLSALKKQALGTKNIEFLGHVSDQELIKLYQQTKAYIFPALEDFGIVTLEAQACGTPVICYGKGGSLETMIDGKTGVYFNEQTPQAVNTAIEQFERFEQDGLFNPWIARKHALHFSKKKFKIELKKVIYGVKGLS